MRLDDDLANVPKFEISDDDYSKRPGKFCFQII